MQATGTLRNAGESKGAWLWLIVIIAGMLLAGAGGYLAHGSSTTAGASRQVQTTAVPIVVQPTAAPTVNEPQFDGGLQR